MAQAASSPAYFNSNLEGADEAADLAEDHYATPTKRHIGSVYRSGFVPTYRTLRSSAGSTGSGVGGGRFSRSGRARQFV